MTVGKHQFLVSKYVFSSNVTRLLPKLAMKERRRDYNGFNVVGWDKKTPMTALACCTSQPSLGCCLCLNVHVCVAAPQIDLNGVIMTAH